MNFAALIGKKFEYGGRGPDSFDCYGLIRHIVKENDGVEIPDYVSPSEGGKIAAIFSTEVHRWQEVPRAPGTVVLIRVPGSMHVGYMVSHDKMIHTWEGSGGVVIEKLHDWERRIIGFYKYGK